MTYRVIKKSLLAQAARKERGLPHTARELHAQQDQEMAGREVLGRCHQVSPELP